MPEDYLGQPQQGSGLAESCGLTTQCEQTGVKEGRDSVSFLLTCSFLGQKFNSSYSNKSRYFTQLTLLTSLMQDKPLHPWLSKRLSQ